MRGPNESRIRRLRAELAEEQELERRWNAKPHDDYTLAELLHERTCHWNHMDQCGWSYETGQDKWEKDSHKTWLKKARIFKAQSAELQKAIEGKDGFDLIFAVLQHTPKISSI